MRSFWTVILSCGIGVWIQPVSGQSPCPGDIAPIEYQPLEHSQIGVQVMMNGQGPYVFMLDTGAQITIADPTLASTLGLRPESMIGIISVARYAEASLFSVDSLGVGQYRVSNLRVAAQSLGQIRAVNPKVQGILGDDFLSGFDLLINYAHRYICLDDTGRMQQAILGQRISTLGKEAIRKSRVVQPVLVPLHISSNREHETIVRLDSGSNAPVLFSSGGEILPWLQRMHASPGRISGTQKGIPFAANAAPGCEAIRPSAASDRISDTYRRWHSIHEGR